MNKQIIGTCAIILAAAPSLFAMDAGMTIDTNLIDLLHISHNSQL